MSRLPTYHLFGGKSHGPAIALAERLAMAPAPMSKALFTCSGSEANDTAIKLVRYYHRCDRQARQTQGHLTPARLPWGDAGLRQPERPAARASRLRTAASGHPAHGMPTTITATLCRGRPRRRSRPGSRRSWSVRSCARTRIRSGFHRRAYHGRRRRHHAARGPLVTTDPGGAREVRRAADRGRGDHRVRAHRRDVRVRALRHPA